MKRFCLIILIFISYFSVAQKNITLEDIWKNKTFKTEALNSLQTLNDGEHYCIVKGDSLIIKLSYKNPDKQTVLFDSYGFLPKDSLKDRHIDMFIFSADEKKMLIAFNIKAKYRRSFLAEFYVFDLEKNKLLPLADNEKIQAPSFSPDGTKVAYVKNNNLFIFDIENKTTFQVTDDGKENEIINGAVDWVYEEEFSISTGFVWSPNSERIAYYRFDETRVKEFSFALYGNIYTEEYTYKYPKAGEQNSIAELRIFDLNSRNIIKVDVGTDTDQYLPRIYWFSSDNFVFMKLNRKQNEMALVSWQHNVAQNIYTEQTDTYIDVELTNVLALNKGENFLITSEKNGYNHVYLYKITGEKISVLTTGNWDILKMYGVNEKKQLLYFQASKDHEINKNIYTLHLKTKEITALTPDKGQNDAYFNENYSGFINVWSDANTPPVYRLCDAKGKVVKVLQNNDTLKKRMAEFGFVPKTFGTITVADSIMLNYWMMQPADFDSSKKYPVFVCQYSGPGSQQVLNRYGGSDFVWYQLLAQKGYIVLCIDARGTGAR